MDSTVALLNLTLKIMKYNILALIACILIFSACNEQRKKEIKLIVRADDMGFCEAANTACVKGYKNGIISSVEVIVPGPKFYEAAALLRKNNGLDVGVHLTLTCEWENYKWGALTQGKSFLNAEGQLASTVEELFAMPIDKQEIKAELKAQIDTALKYIPQVSHISSHMFWQTNHQVLQEVFNELSTEYKLPVNPENVAFENFWIVDAEKKEEKLAEYLNTINDSSINIFIVHPAIDNEETQVIIGTGYDPNINMAKHRQAVTNAITNPRMLEIIKKRNIKLISYANAFTE